MAVADPDQLVRDASAAAQEQRWWDAAQAYGQAAEIAEQRGLPEPARACWDQAGECWRRDDRPEAAVDALTRAFDLAESAPHRVTAQVKMAGALGELGRFEEAERGCALAAGLVQGPLRAVVLDTWCDHLLALGDLQKADGLVAELGAQPGALGAAGSFRRAQLHRLRGRLLDAELQLSEVQVRLAEEPRAVSARAAATAELGEIRLLQGRYTEATSLLEQAFSGQGEARRGAPLWRAEAARVRALVASGAQPLVGRLSEGLRYARERGLVVLEADILFARGVAGAKLHAAQASADLQAAANAADAFATPLRAGRSRLAWARLLEGSATERRAVLQAARELLSFSPLWEARAELAWFEQEPQSADAIAALRKKLGRFGLRPELERAARLAPPL